MKQLSYLLLPSALGFVFFSACGHSVSKPTSEAADLANSIYDKAYNTDAVFSHAKEVVEQIKFEPITHTYKIEKYKKGTECGNGLCKTLEDKSRCFIKYTKGSEWGVLKELTYPCEGNDKEELLKAALKRAKSALTGLTEPTRAQKPSAVQFVSKSTPALAKSIIGAKTALGENFCMEQCIDDHLNTMTATNQAFHEWGCDTAWTGDMLVKQMGMDAQIASMTDDIKQLDCEKDDAYCKRTKAMFDNQLKLLKDKKAHVASLTGDKAKLYAHVNLGTDRSCLNKWLNANEKYSHNQLLTSALEQCGLDVGGEDIDEVSFKLGEDLAALRDEALYNMKGIKTSQISYESDNDVYVTCAAYPSTPTKTTNQWTKSASGGFATLNWSPDGDVRGSYQVSTTTTNFVITALTDVDGDGVYATFVATKSENPHRLTAPDVY